MTSPNKAEKQDLLDTIRRQEQQIRDFERLNTVLEKVNSVVQVEDTLKLIIEEVMQFCGADEVSIMLLDIESQSEPLTLLREGRSGDQRLDYHLNRLLAGWVIRHQTSLLSDNLAEIIGQKNVKAIYGGISSVLSTPLVEEGKITGVINLISESKERVLGKREQQLMSILASQCALFIRNARLHDDLFEETTRLRNEVQNRYERHGIIGHGVKMQSVFALLDSIIPTDVRVLIQGESGTGKERVARAIHYSGPRKDAPFVAVDCGALPANLLESELFGYVKGAFTGANLDRKGLFEEAHGGTLFLDEIENMPLKVQVKFLRAIQENEFRPLGANQIKKVDVRILAAATESLQEAVRVGNFREDLFYRLNVVNITLPPLRERKEDIAILAAHFLKQMADKYGKNIKGLEPNTISALEPYAWPGNIRELENAIERAVVLSKTDQLSDNAFTFLTTSSSLAKSLPVTFQPQPLEDALFEMKRAYVSRVLEYAGGVKKKAAELMQIQPTYLSRLLKNLKIED